MSSRVIIRQLLDDGVLGEVRTVLADHGEFFTPDHRIYDAELAGGPLLDLGTYPIALAHMVFGSFISVRAQGPLRCAISTLEVADEIRRQLG